MSKPVDDERLLAVAGSISDGVPVDWNEVRQRFAESADSAIVEELQVLHGLAAVHVEPSSWGPLQTVDVLGQGAFATVYRAFDTDLQREIALKVTMPEDAAGFDPQRAVREARLLARVRHPNVVTVFGAQRRGEAVALAMELIKGLTLDDLVRNQGPLSARETALIGIDLCRALAAVHEAGLLHGDIKAHNVMREEGGRTVLMDFGTGRDLHAPVPSTGDFAGTPLYLAPEVFAGRPRTKASDIYSLGILLYYLSTGMYPINGDTRTEVDRRHSQPQSRRRLRDVRPDLPGAFIAVVERAAAEDPAKRYQTAGEFEAALVAVIDERRVEPNPKPSPVISPTVAAAVLIAAVLVVAGLYGLYVRFGAGADERVGGTVASAETGASPASKSTTVGANDGMYRVEAAMYRLRDGLTQRLQRSDRLSPGDALFLQVETSAPTHVYVVNEDDRGEAFLLYPLPGQPREPLASGIPNRLPGLVAGKPQNWRVTSAGGREHFVMFFSPTRVPEIEQFVTSLPTPRENADVSYAPVLPELMQKLRGLGGLVAAPASNARRPRLSDRYTTPLSDGPEDAHGLWVRHIAFENPSKK